MKNTIFLLLATCLISLGSCSKKLTTLTQKIYDKYNWSDEELRRIQFYISTDLTLTRGLFEGDTTVIKNGIVKVVNGTKTEIFFIPKGTKGVFVSRTTGGNLGIGFEEDSDARSLTFLKNPKFGDKYTLGLRTHRSDPSVTFHDVSFAVVYSSMPTLQIDLRKIEKHERRFERLKGKKVKD